MTTGPQSDRGPLQDAWRSFRRNRAALFGQGVLPQDVDLVDNRLGVLNEECNFRERHKQVADRHARATRYMSPEFRLCTLAESILTGIMTPAERQQLATCRATENNP